MTVSAGREAGIMGGIVATDGGERIGLAVGFMEEVNHVCSDHTARCPETITKDVRGAWDPMIPPDESVSLKGTRFTNFEDQVEALGRAVLSVALEERAALEGNAEVLHPSCCPYCGSALVFPRA